MAEPRKAVKPDDDDVTDLEPDDLDSGDDVEFVGDLNTAETEEDRDPAHESLFQETPQLPHDKEPAVEYELVDEDEEPDPEPEPDDDADDDDEVEDRQLRRPEPVESPDLAARRAAEKVAADRGAENQQLRERNRQLEEGQLTLAEQSIEGEHAGLKDALRKATEDGETDKVVDVQDQLAALHARKQNLAAYKRRLEAAPKEQPAERQPDVPRELSDLAKAWTADKDWFANPKDPRRIYTISVDSEMAVEGWVADSQAYFDELDRRIAPVLKQYRKPRKPKDVARERTRRAARSPVAPARPANAEPEARPNGKVKLTPTDLRTMEAFGLDSTSPTDLADFAAERRNTMRQEKQERRRRRA